MGTALNRVRRFVLPLTVLSLAAAALGTLGVSELLGDPSEPSRPARTQALRLAGAGDGPVAPPKATTPPRAPAPAPRTTPPAPPRSPAPVAPVAAEPTRVASGPRRIELPAIEPRRPRVKETQSVLRASAFVGELARAKDLEERMRQIDDLVRTLSPEQATPILEGLLDSELPGDHYEAENLRLCVLARLGSLPGAKASSLLLARLDPDRPRPERLMALEMLAERPDGRPRVEDVARDDHDVVVRDTARRALARAR